MNRVLENVMIFINENTNILIGICLFLIFVLIGYLIDNSIKSRRARKDFKKSQSSEEIPVQINTELTDPREDIINLTSEANKNLFEDVVSTPKVDIDLEQTYVEDAEESPIKEDESTIENVVPKEEDKPNEDVETEIDNLNGVVEAIDSVNIDIDKEEQKEENEDVIYKNDKKLSEILFSDINNEEQKEPENSNEISDDLVNNIFIENKQEENIEVKNEKSKVEIELDEDELDNIMRKLKNISSLDSDDSYTNIF